MQWAQFDGIQKTNDFKQIISMENHQKIFCKMHCEYCDMARLLGTVKICVDFDSFRKTFQCRSIFDEQFKSIKNWFFTFGNRDASLVHLTHLYGSVNKICQSLSKSRGFPENTGHNRMTCTTQKHILYSEFISIFFFPLLKSNKCYFCYGAIKFESVEQQNI